MTQEVYAFGDDSIDGEACPAVAAGFDTTGKVLTIAEQYDSLVLSRYGIDEGVLPESVAESCWNDAIAETLSNARYYEGRDLEHSEYLREAAEKGKEIRDILF
jgi:hypothetical protein